MKHIFLLLAVVILCACSKNKASESTIGDEVVGTYDGFSGAQRINVQVSKVASQKYIVRKISTATLPEFTLQYKLNLLGLFAYDVPAQGSIRSDSSSASYFETQRRFQFSLMDNNGTKWTYDGFKQ